jgi:hypothetical protein
MNDQSSNPLEQSQGSAIESKNLASLLKEFESEFPSREACLDELYRLAQIEIKCRVCHNHSLEIRTDRRAGKCINCKKTTRFTAGTVLEHMKMPKPRLAAIWFFSKGAVLNSLVFSRLLKIAQSSAHGILNWLRFTMQSVLPADAPLLHSSLFAPAFSKRSRQTPARERPVAEQEEMEKMADVERNDRCSIPEPQKTNMAVSQEFGDDSNRVMTEDAGEFSQQQEQIYKLLSDLPLHFEALCNRANVPIGTLSAVLTVLEIEGKAERLEGDWYVRRMVKQKIQAPSEKASRTIDAFLQFVRLNFRGISRRYLQGYLAAYWCRIERSNWSSEAFWQECLGAMSKSYQQIRTYVTPLWVKLFPV